MTEPLPPLLARTRALHDRIDALSNAPEDVGWLAPGVRHRVSNGAPAAPARRLALLAPLAAAALLFVVVIGRNGMPQGAPPAGEGTERVKGPAASLNIFRQTPSGSELLEDGSLARAGDVIRVGYRLAGPGYGVIVSVDGRGVVTRHLPSSAGRAATMANGEVVLLDQAYELDDAPQWERFFIVTGDSAFDVEPIVRAAKSFAESGATSPTLSLPAELGQSTFLLKKDTRP